MKKKRLLCFDFDNTLVSSDTAHILAYNKSFVKNGLPAVSPQRLKKEFGQVGRVVVQKVYPHLKPMEVAKIIHDHHLFLIRETLRYVKPIPGAIAVLQQLRENYRIVLTSNCGISVLHALMRGAGIDHNLFDLCITQDNVKHPKPAPDEIFKAEHLLHLEADYMIGDSIYDVRAGKKAGVKVIAVLTGNHSRSVLAKEKPFKIISSIRELPKAI